MEFSGKHSFPLHPSLDPYGQNNRQRNTLILVGLATLTGSSRLILVGLATLTGSSRLILVRLATQTSSSRYNPGWAGHPDGFLQVNPGWAGHPDGFLQVHLLRVGWGNLFPVVLLFQFFVLGRNRFGFYILLMYLEYHTVVVLCKLF